ncbi:MAG: G8 domain-containing protein [Planctomycetes bacterium]|nr:G8 domain-containing protein [Planctomycetota bacterium]
MTTLRRSLLFAALGAALTATSVAAQSVAKPALPTTDLPPLATANGSFELSSVTPTNTPVASPAWGAWAFGSGTGIAYENTIKAPGDAPDGDRVAYIDGQGIVQVSADVSPGYYRIHYYFARQVSGSSISNQGLTIRVNSKLIANDEDFSGTYKEYVTRPFLISNDEMSSFVFQGTDDSSAHTGLLDRVLLEPLQTWNSTVWNPTIPKSSTDATIPAGSVVVLTGNAACRQLTVNGELVVPDTSVALEVANMKISGAKARFEIGRRQVQYDPGMQFILNLTEPVATTGNHRYIIIEESGSIEMHGCEKTSWTRLTATAALGTKTLQVLEHGGWKIGDAIAVVGSEGQSLPGNSSSSFTNRSEMHTIDSINGNTIHLQQALIHRHIASTPSYNNGAWTQEMRAEVGMLSHNIRVIGTPNSPVFNTDNGMGGHIMVRAINDAAQSTVRLSSVELVNMGQSGRLGRYPMHWHMCRDAAAGHYIERSSIHHTWNRAVTIHGTDAVRLKDNVAYRNLGHAVFLEDGSEMDNTIERNLVAATLKPTADQYTILDSDAGFDEIQNRSPSAFWITNPQNTVDDNVAADTIGTGFWLTFAEQVIGLSASTTGSGHHPTAVPNTIDLTSFRGNIAHGCRNGFDINDGLNTDGSLRKNLTYTPVSGIANIENFKAYACNTALYTGQSFLPTALVFKNAVLTDNEVAVRFASSDIVENSVIVADSMNVVYPTIVPNRKLEAYSVYDGAGTLRDCLVQGYDQTSTSLFGIVPAALRRTNHLLDNVSFSNAPQSTNIFFPEYPTSNYSSSGSTVPVTTTRPDDPRSWGFSIYDPAGNLTQIPGTSIIGSHPWMHVGNETPWPNGTHAFVTTNKFGHLFVEHLKASGNPNQDPGLVTFDRLHTNSSQDAHFDNYYIVDLRKQMPVILNRPDITYAVGWKTVPSSLAALPEISVRVGGMSPTDRVIIRFDVGRPNTVLYDSSTSPRTQLAVATDQDAALSDEVSKPTYFVDDAGNVYLHIVNAPPADGRFEFEW